MHEDNAQLQLYAETRSEPAFSSLVQRHLPLVYSAALRQTGDPHQAQEIAQTVFLTLARKAGTLREHPALGGWLYTTTCYTAAKARRTEQRRRRREQEVQTMQAPPDVPLPTDDWVQLRPVIDETMLLLKEDDRTAVLLRFFENRPYGEIGARLGLSENTARMRVERALEALRTALSRRGIASTAAALGTVLSAQAVLTPPAGLAVAITAGVGSAATGGVLLLLMKPTLLKTGLLTAVLCAGTAGLLWQQRENTRLRDEIRQQRSQAAATPPRTPAKAASTPSHDGAEMDRLRAQIAELSDNPAVSWQNRVDQLRKLLAQLPELSIPELALATDEDWLDAAKNEMTSEGDYRRALSRLRTLAVQRFIPLASQALKQYLDSHGGAFPTEATQLQPYLKQPLNAAILQRYAVLPAASVPSLGMGGDWIITIRQPVDEDYDVTFAIGPNGSGSTSSSFSPRQEALFKAVVKAYIAANPGKNNEDFNELLPYATTPEQRQAVQKALDLARNPAPP